MSSVGLADERIKLLAHLMRRVGVGATRDELEQLVERPHEDVVEELLRRDPPMSLPTTRPTARARPRKTSSATSRRLRSAEES